MANSMSQSQPDSSHASCASTLDPELLKILRCPESLGTLVLRGNELWCRKSGKAYRVDGGIPVMLVEEARALDSAEIASLGPGLD
jgi:hypothetical protein